jgi:hypothetical protein
VDLVGADRGPVARKIAFVGSIKWFASPFDRHDLSNLTHAAPQVPGFTLRPHHGPRTATLSGPAPDADDGTITLCWGPEETIQSWE